MFGETGWKEDCAEDFVVGGTNINDVKVAYSPVETNHMCLLGMMLNHESRP